MSTVSVTGGHIQANGIRQHYLRYAGGPSSPGTPLLIVPGITSPAITWGFVAKRLASYADTFVLDVRGRGLSQSGPDLDYGIDTLAGDLAAFVAALGLRDATVVGHSMGARIAARAAARGMEGLGRLVLMDPPVSGPGRRPYPGQLPWYVDSIRAASAGMDADAMRVFCPSWTREQLELRAEWLHTCYEPAIRKAYADFHEDDFQADLPRIAVPALLMIAGRGDVIRVEDEAEIHGLLPSIQVVRVPNAGHMIPWDDLEGCLAALVRFLQNEAPRSAA